MVTSDERPSIGHYLKTRITELAPSKVQWNQNKHLLNPIPGLRLITKKTWIFIAIALAGWTWVAFDFFIINMNTTQLSEDFDVKVKDITWGITLVLMVRTIGAVIFGYLGDKYGRKIPFIVNIALMCVLEIGTGFIKTYKQFLGVRCIYGILMGGIYGNAAATALDDCPTEARGFISGLMQEGYALGYLLSVIFTRALADTTPKKWRSMMWFAAGISAVIVVLRAILPETEAFRTQRAREQEALESGAGNDTEKKVSFKNKAVGAWKSHWMVLIYLVFLMSGFNFMSHGSQDLFPTYLKKQLQFSSDAQTVTNCVANIGAIIGGIFVGHMSNFLGRRFCIIICCIVGGALLYPWGFIHNSSVNASVFFLQFCVQGAWGVIPIHLSELSPPDFRSFIVGVSYQLGNLASSASSTIETTIGERFPIYIEGETDVYNYGKVMCIFMGCVFAFVLILTLMGPEKKGANINAAPSSDEIEEIEKDEPVEHQPSGHESDKASVSSGNR